MRRPSRSRSPDKKLEQDSLEEDEEEVATVSKRASSGGRPAKTPKQKTITDFFTSGSGPSSAYTSAQKSIQGKRGRPPKRKQDDPPPPEEEEVVETKKKSKSKQIQDTSVSPGRGRPPKTQSSRKISVSPKPVSRASSSGSAVASGTPKRSKVAAKPLKTSSSKKLESPTKKKKQTHPLESTPPHSLGLQVKSGPSSGGSVCSGSSGKSTLVDQDYGNIAALVKERAVQADAEILRRKSMSPPHRLLSPSHASPQKKVKVKVEVKTPKGTPKVLAVKSVAVTPKSSKSKKIGKTPDPSETPSSSRKTPKDPGTTPLSKKTPVSSARKKLCLSPLKKTPKSKLLQESGLLTLSGRPRRSVAVGAVAVAPLTPAAVPTTPVRGSIASSTVGTLKPVQLKLKGKKKIKTEVMEPPVPEVPEVVEVSPKRKFGGGDKDAMRKYLKKKALLQQKQKLGGISPKKEKVLQPKSKNKHNSSNNESLGEGGEGGEATGPLSMQDDRAIKGGWGD